MLFRHIVQAYSNYVLRGSSVNKGFRFMTLPPPPPVMEGMCSHHLLYKRVILLRNPAALVGITHISVCRLNIMGWNTSWVISSVVPAVAGVDNNGNNREAEDLFAMAEFGGLYGEE